jgi:hypothetical protein
VQSFTIHIPKSLLCGIDFHLRQLQQNADGNDLRSAIVGKYPYPLVFKKLSSNFTFRGEGATVIATHGCSSMPKMLIEMNSGIDGSDDEANDEPVQDESSRAVQADQTAIYLEFDDIPSAANEGEISLDTIKAEITVLGLIQKRVLEKNTSEEGDASSQTSSSSNTARPADDDSLATAIDKPSTSRVARKDADKTPTHKFHRRRSLRRSEPGAGGGVFRSPTVWILRYPGLLSRSHSFGSETQRQGVQQESSAPHEYSQ